MDLPPVVEGLIADQVFQIAAYSVANARAWKARLDSAINGLSEVNGYAIDEEASDEEASDRLGTEVRHLLFERTYLVHYTLDDVAGVVRVIGFRHGARRRRRGEP